MASNIDELRNQLVEHLVGDGLIRSVAVQRAFAAVPRHVFLPGVAPAAAYADEAVVTGWDGEGRPTSSSSQPSIMALMLEQLGPQPGDRVLEIGAGTGYNAALLAHLVGPSGSVVTVDIDPDVVRRARHNLDEAGCARVEVRHADGADGWPATAPHDRIICTAAAWDIASGWIAQLVGDGRLVLALSLRGAQRSVAFERVNGALQSVSIVDCGFMPMRGKLAGPATARALNRPGIFLDVDDGRPLDTAAFTAALDGPAAQLSTGLQVSAAAIMSGLDLWLSLNDPDTARLGALGAAAAGIVPALVSYPGMTVTFAVIGDGSLAALARHDAERGGGSDTFALDVLAYGPHGERLAHRLAAQLHAWAGHDRPSTQNLRIRAYPRELAPSRTPGSIVIDKPRTRFVLSWQE